MRRNILLFAGIATLVLLLGHGYASNMGFTMPMLLNGPADGISKSGQAQISLPYNPEDAIQSASDLRDSINRAAGAPDCVGDACAVVSVSRFLSQTDSLQTYAPGPGASDFPILGHEGLRIQVRQDVQWMAFGSHDPGRVIRLPASEPGVSATGITDFALPYHTTLTTSSELLEAINASSLVGNAVVSVSRFIRSSDSQQVYSPGPFEAANDFELSPGESYRIQVDETVEFLPAHY